MRVAGVRGGRPQLRWSNSTMRYAIGIEEPPVVTATSGSGTAVEQDDGLAVVGAARPPSTHLPAPADVQQPRVVGLDLRKQVSHDLTVTTSGCPGRMPRRAAARSVSGPPAVLRVATDARGTRPVPDPAGPGQESVWDYPRPPRVEHVDVRVTIDLGGERVVGAAPRKLASP